MINALAVELEDDQFMAEISLVTDLMIAATESAEPLQQSRIDAILGLRTA